MLLLLTVVNYGVRPWCDYRPYVHTEFCENWLKFRNLKMGRALRHVDIMVNS